MATDSPKETDISVTFLFEYFDREVIARGIEKNLLPLIEPEPTVVGTITIEGTPRKTSRYDIANEWVSALDSQISARGQLRINSRDYARSFTMDVDMENRTIDVCALWKLPLPAEVWDIILEFGHNMKWTLQQREKSSSRVRIERVFRLAKPECSEWLERAMSAAQALLPRSRFGGHVSVRSPTEYVFEFERPADWEDRISHQWAAVHTAGFDFHHDQRSIVLRCSFERADARISVQTGSEKATAEMFETFVRQIGLVDEVTGPASPLRPEGAGQQYFTRDIADEAWFDIAVSVLKREVDPLSQFNGRFHRLSSPDTAAMIFSDIARWTDDVKRNWADLDRIYGWLPGARATISIDYNVRREIVKLEVQAGTQQEANGILQRIATELNLDAFQGRPFQYRKHMRIFTIATWDDNEGLAAAIKEAFSQAFPRKHVLVDASLAEGQESETLKPFQLLDDFLNSLQTSGKIYRRVQLTGEGPRGVALGLSADRADMKLTIKSSLDRPAFNVVTQAMEKNMDVKFFKEVNSEKQEGKSKTDSLPVKLFLLLAALFFSTNFLSEVIPKYSIEITTPGKRDEKPITISSGVLNVEWELKKKQFWTEKRLLDRFAEVRVYSPEDKPLLTVQNQPARCNISLKDPSTGASLIPGRYQVRVETPDLVSRPIEFLIEAAQTR